MFYVVILYFFLAAGNRELGAHRLWQPGALIYSLEHHCAASREVELKPTLISRQVTRVRTSEMLHCVIRQTEASKLLGIRIEHYLVFARRNRNTIALEGLHAVPVEDKHQVAALVCYHLITLVVAEFLFPWQMCAIEFILDWS